MSCGEFQDLVYCDRSCNENMRSTRPQGLVEYIPETVAWAGHSRVAVEMWTLMFQLHDLAWSVSPVGWWLLSTGEHPSAVSKESRVVTGFCGSLHCVL